MHLIGQIQSLTPMSVRTVIWIGVGLAVAFTMIRTVTRIHVFGRLYADDACVYFALAMLIATGVLYNYITPIMFEFEYTFHKEKEAAAGFKERVEFFLRLQFAIIVLFWTTIWAVKLSFLLWYRKMLVGFTDRKILWPFVLIFSLCAYLGCWVTQLESCQPISHYFTLGGCETKRDIYVSNLSLYYSTAVDILCDILIMALPLRLLLGLQITEKQKFALTAIFSLALIIITFAIVRVIKISASAEHVDPIWLAVWSMTEASVAVIVACLPSFHVLLTARSSSAFNRRNRASPGSDIPNNQSPSPMLSQHNSLRDLDEEVAGIIMGHQAETQAMNAFAKEEERTQNEFRESSLFEVEKANKNLTEKNGLI